MSVEFGSVLDIIIKITLGFASLAGVSALVAVLVQILKLVGVAKDDTAGKWAAGFNLVAFLALVYFGVFQPQIAIEILDGYAAQIAVIALFVLGFVTQMTVSKPTYSAFKGANVPLLQDLHQHGEQACYIEEDFEHSKFLNHVSQTARKARHAFEDTTIECATCGGIGVVANHLKRTVRKCKTCKGSGRVRK